MKEKYPKETAIFKEWLDDYMGQEIDFGKLPREMQRIIWIKFESVVPVPNFPKGGVN